MKTADLRAGEDRVSLDQLRHCQSIENRFEFDVVLRQPPTFAHPCVPSAETPRGPARRARSASGCSNARVGATVVIGPAPHYAWPTSAATIDTSRRCNETWHLGTDKGVSETGIPTRAAKRTVSAAASATNRD